MRVLYFGTYDRAYPRNAQVISALRERRRRGARAAPGRLGAAPQLVGRAAADAAGGRGGAEPSPLARRRARRRRPDRRLSRALRPAGSEARGAGAARGLQPPRLALRHARRRPRPLSPWITRRRSGAPRRPARLPPRRCRRRGHRGARACSSAEEFGLADDRVRGVLRRRRGPALSSGLAAGATVPRPVRRQADPSARARDHPRRRLARLRDPVSRRRERPARAPSRRAAAQRRLGAVGRVRGPSRRDPVRGLCARHLRNRCEGGPGDPEQGIPGDRLRHPARDGGHTCRPRAPDRRQRRPSRPGVAIRTRSQLRCGAWPRSRRLRRRSVLPAGRRTRPGRARPPSAAAGGNCSSARSRRRDEAARAALARGRRLCRRDVGARGASAAGLRDGALRRRQPDAGRLVDRPRPVPRGHRPPGRPDLPARSPLRSARRAARTPLVGCGRARTCFS